MNARSVRLNNVVKYSAIFAILGFALSSGLAACGKKSEDSNQLTYGSLVSDGNGVTSTSSLGGYQLNFGIQDVKMTSYMNNTAYNYNYSYNSVATLSSTVTVNNQAQVLTTSVFSNPNYVQQPAYTSINGYTVLHQAACYEVACTNIALMVAFGTNVAFKQVLVKKNLVDNKIVSLKEWDVPSSGLRSLSALMAEVP